jgi:RNA polymerase sigma factor (sigma-70 family)
MNAAARPSSDAFAGSIDAYRHDVILLCYRFLGSIAEAEEAAQETALRAWRARDRFRGDSGLRTWLHQIATRVCLDALRSRHGRGRVLPPGVAAASTDHRRTTQTAAPGRAVARTDHRRSAIAGAIAEAADDLRAGHRTLYRQPFRADRDSAA